MTDARQDQPRSAFDLRTIGPEPSGATPLEPEDLEGLIPDFVATRADLNVVEFENITKALPWALQQARTRQSEGVLVYGFMMDLHRRTFGDVWTWAGIPRRRETNIGVAPQLVPSQSMQTLDDAKYWHTEKVFEPEGCGWSRSEQSHRSRRRQFAAPGGMVPSRSQAMVSVMSLSRSPGIWPPCWLTRVTAVGMFAASHAPWAGGTSASARP
jgi:hypothetical protein